MSAGVTLGAESTVQLVQAVYLGHFLVRQELIEQSEVVITHHREMMLQSNLRQAGRKIGADGICYDTNSSFRPATQTSAWPCSGQPYLSGDCLRLCLLCRNCRSIAQAGIEASQPAHDFLACHRRIAELAVLLGALARGEDAGRD